MSENNHSRKIFYGWYVVAACFAVTFTLGETFWSFRVFFKPLQNEFGWTRTVVSSSFTAFMIGYAITVVTAGRLVDRNNPRLILLGGALAAGLGVALCSQVNDINGLRIYLAIAGMGAGATWSVPTAMVQRWFHLRPNAGLALSIVVSGVGVGAFVFTPLSNYLILTRGWRTTYLLIGIIYFVIIVLASFIIKHPPQGSAVPVNDGQIAKTSFNHLFLRYQRLESSPQALSWVSLL
ncbi:MAG: MFS transporter, partial [Dehalococcoidales bacterium]|nr:MFS transporter [Dehalococcoidales bacterium]